MKIKRYKTAAMDTYTCVISNNLPNAIRDMKSDITRLNESPLYY